MAPGAAQAAAAAIGHQKLRLTPTLQAWEKKGSGISASSAQTNSPWDLTWVGGPVVRSAEAHDIYVNCPSGPAACWGTGSLTPATFQEDFNSSNLLTVANQYIDENADGKFPVAPQLSTTFKFTDDGDTASLQDIFQIIYSAVSKAGGVGYTNIYHVFLPQGQDMCIDATDCYAPDNPAVFQFCAFHGSVDLPQGHVLFSVEPYEAIGACTLPTQTRVIDATVTALSHETMETITDPDLDAWFNLLNGYEIGDLCFGFRMSQFVGHRWYTVQSEYSNNAHACVTGT